MGKTILQIIALAVGVYVAWWVVAVLVLPLVGIALGLLMTAIKLALLAILVYAAYLIFKSWNRSAA